jgi:hypothetical protein
MLLRRQPRVQCRDPVSYHRRSTVLPIKGPEGVALGHNRDVSDDPLEALRNICLGLPEVTERLSHGEPTWFVRGKKTFVMYADHHHDDRPAFWCAAPPGAQEVLVDSAPDRFFVPPYVGHRGWLGVWLDVPVDWDEIADLVTDAYREVAPKGLLAELDT